MGLAETLPDPKLHLKPQDTLLQEDSVVNNKQDLRLRCLSPSCPPHEPEAPSPSSVPCLTQILGQLWKMDGGTESEVGCSQSQVPPKQSHSVSILDDTLENAKPLPARA